MKRCDSCQVNVTSAQPVCPLCQGRLRKLNDHWEETFPTIPTVYKQNNLLFRILILLSICSVIICGAINLMLPASGLWSLFVLAGVGCVWLSVAFALHKRGNIPKNMLYQAVIVSVLSVLWDAFTGWRGWSLDYVVPIVCLCAMAALLILMRVMRRYIEDQIIYLCIGALFGLVPILFWALGCLRVTVPSLICAAVCLIALAALAVFRGESLRAELRRKLHI